MYSSMQGVDDRMDSTPSQGTASAIIKSTDGMFDETISLLFARAINCFGKLDKLTTKR